MVKKWIFILPIALILIGVAILFFGKSFNKSKTAISKEMSVQIYPNYEFPDGVNKITIPLIPCNQRLSQENGGWVITPVSSSYRIDHKVSINIEFIDGTKFHEEPHVQIWLGLKRGVFRLYGEGEAVVTVERKD